MMRALFISLLLILPKLSFAGETSEISFIGRSGTETKSCNVLQRQINYINNQLSVAGLIFRLEVKKCELVESKLLNYTVRYKTAFKTIEETHTNMVKFNELFSMRDYCETNPDSDYYAFVLIRGGNSNIRDVMISNGFEPIPEHSNSSYRISFCKPLEELKNDFNNEHRTALTQSHPNQPSNAGNR